MAVLVLGGYVTPHLRFDAGGATSPKNSSGVWNRLFSKGATPKSHTAQKMNDDTGSFKQFPDWVKYGRLGSGIPDPGSGILDPVSGIRDPRPRIPDPVSRIPDPGARTLDPGSGIPDPGSGVRDTGSGVRDPGSGVRDPGSGIPHP